MHINIGPASINVSRIPRMRPYASYAEALDACDGYESEDLLDIVLLKTLSLIDRPMPLSAYELHALLGIYKVGKPKVSVLDFGGACGAHYFNLRGHASLDWTVVETPGMVERAKKISVNATSVIGGKPDLVFTSGALQYTPDPFATLDQLLALKAPVFVWTRGVTADRFTVRVQESRLSDNGPGVMPEGFTDRTVRYPCTYIRRKDALDRLRSTYPYVIELPSDGFAVLCHR